MSKKPKVTQRRTQRPTPPPRGPLTLVALGVLAAVFAVGAVALLAWRNASQPASSGSATGSPSLKADRTQVDLGDVRLGETVSVSFELKNTGTGTLRFSEAPWVEVVEGC